MHDETIYDYIQEEENRFKTDEIQVGENWFFNFRKHVQIIFHLLNGVFYTGENNFSRAFKQVMRPLIRLSIWTEDIEVKDVVFFVEGQNNRAISFLIKKYYDEVYTREHDLDTFIDKLTESDIAYGAALVQKGVDAPEVIPLQSVAFCDQTDMLGGPIGFKHNFTPDKLRSMSTYGWGKESNGADITLEDLCELACEEKTVPGAQGGQKNTTSGKTIEVYIVRGSMPNDYLNDDGDFGYYCNQLQIRAFYTNKDSKKVGVCLYRKKENEGNLKVHISEEVYNRALGYSDGEAMLHPQVFSNFLTIHKMNMLEAAAKVPLYTDDPSYTSKNKIQDMETLEVTVIEDGKKISQVPTAAPVNVQLLTGAINEWYETSQLNVSAFDSLMGKEESAGMTFRGQERLITQGRGWHDRRRGQRAKFIELVHRDWIIPDMVKMMNKGKEFIASLTGDEMNWVADHLATNYSNRKIAELVLNGKMPTLQDQDMLSKRFKQEFFKKGNKHLLEILKGEMNDIADKIGINIVNKQKDLGQLSDKLVSILQNAMANPQGFMESMKVPALARTFENILEYSNVPIPDFYSLIQAQPNAPVTSPIQQNNAGQVTPPAPVIPTPNGTAG